MKKKFFVSTLLLLSLAAALIFLLSACREPEAPPTEEETLMTCYECADEPVMKHYPYVAPTCKSTGRSEYWECEVCNAAYIKYRDQALFAHVTELADYVVLPALPHAPDFAVTETTHSMTQYRCGCPLEGERIEGAHQMDARAGRLARLRHNREQKHEHAHAAEPMAEAAPIQVAAGKRFHVAENGRTGGGKARDDLKQRVDIARDLA